MIDYLTNYGDIDINILNLIISIIVALILNSLIVFSYRITHRSMTYDSSFIITLLLMGPIISVIIIVIGHNIALSIGLVGSLSIIRFRTVIKDSKDLIYLLWAISVGLGTGSENWFAITVASIVISLIVFFLHFIKFGIAVNNDNILIVNGKNYNIKRNILQILREEKIINRFRSLEKTGDNFQIVFELKNNNNNENKDSFDRLIKKIEKIDSVNNVSILSPNLTLPI